MAQNFLADSDRPNASFLRQTVENIPPGREALKHLLIGSPKGVTNAIHSLQVRGYAEVGAWSPLLPTANPGEVMSILLKYIQVQ
jgi:hypothetical protein